MIFGEPSDNGRQRMIRIIFLRNEELGGSLSNPQKSHGGLGLVSYFMTPVISSNKNLRKRHSPARNMSRSVSLGPAEKNPGLQWDNNPYITNFTTGPVRALEFKLHNLL